MSGRCELAKRLCFQKPIKSRKAPGLFDRVFPLNRPQRTLWTRVRNIVWIRYFHLSCYVLNLIRQLWMCYSKTVDWGAETENVLPNNCSPLLCPFHCLFELLRLYRGGYCLTDDASNVSKECMLIGNREAKPPNAWKEANGTSVCTERGTRVLVRIFGPGTGSMEADNRGSS